MCDYEHNHITDSDLNLTPENSIVFVQILESKI